ncbi:lipase class 3 family protein, partial [Fistulina hepatica ATCC 64428]
ITPFKPYTYYASTAYCDPSTTLNWTCGDDCEANADFEPLASGGNGGTVQFWYVGYDPSLDTMIVAHQGTDPSKLAADLTDAEFVLVNLDSTLFPGVPSDVLVHAGFRDAQADTATTILSYVQSGMSTYGTNTLTVVGHSLGGAIALLDGVYFDIQLPDADVIVITYGQPRVGNQAWANYVDANVNRTHINNKEDYVPILPPLYIDYVHASGEIHIMDDNEWIACAGQDNNSTMCSTGDVPNVLAGNISYHDGPYDGVLMGC